MALSCQTQLFCVTDCIRDPSAAKVHFSVFPCYNYFFPKFCSIIKECKMFNARYCTNLSEHDVIDIHVIHAAYNMSIHEL